MLTDSNTLAFKKIFITRRLFENSLVFLLQYSGLVFTTLTLNSYPVWFASGTACAFIFLRGLSVLPGVWLGSFAAYYFLRCGFLLAFNCAMIFLLQSFLLVWLSYRFITPTLIFYRKTTFLFFIFLSMCLTAMASFLLVLLCFPRSYSLILWLQWWLANLNGILVFGFGLIALDAYFPQAQQFKELNKFTLVFFYGALLLAVAAIIFVTPLAILITLPLIFVISRLYGWCGLVAAVFLLGFLLTLAASFEMIYASLFLKLFFTAEVIGTCFFVVRSPFSPLSSRFLRWERGRG